MKKISLVALSIFFCAINGAKASTSHRGCNFGDVYVPTKNMCISNIKLNEKNQNIKFKYLAGKKYFFNKIEDKENKFKIGHLYRCADLHVWNKSSCVAKK